MKDELDILREVGSTAAAHGSTALSELLKTKVTLSMSRIDVVSCEDISSKIESGWVGVGIISRIIIGLQGDVMFMLDEKNAFKIVGLSYKIKGEEDIKEKDKTRFVTEVGLSLIKEVGNIVTITYLNTLSLMLNRVIIPYPPTLISGTVDYVLELLIAAYKEEDYVFLIETFFEGKERNIKGNFFLILTPKAAKDIRETCKEMLDS